MNKENVLIKLNEVFAEVMELEDLKLEEDHTADDIEEWDSLSHIQVITEIEKRFNIRFTTMEIEDFKNVKGMISKILEKKN